MADAPGWASSELDHSFGPECWRCRGKQTVVRKVNKKIRRENRVDAKDLAGKCEENRVVLEECPVCNGVGRMPVKKKLKKNEANVGTMSKRERHIPDDWVVPGPNRSGAGETLSGEELCHLLGHWRIYQQIGGHRWSTDDLVTAWLAGVAWRDANPDQSPQNCLDLGCGIGTVLMMTAWQFTDAKVLGIEAQKLSASMARRSIKFNSCDDRCAVVNGDIREYEHFTSHSPDGKFDLVTGTPPYFPVTYDRTGAASTTVGGLPTCEQSAPARYEFRGGVEAYCAAAKPRLRDANSRFVVCEGFLDTNHDRVLESAAANGLDVLRQVCVHGREDKAALFAVYEMALADKERNGDFAVEKLIVRHKGGRRSDAYINLMKSMGIPP